MYQPAAMHTESELRLVRLLRVWLAARVADKPQLAAVLDRAAAIGALKSVAIRADALFQLLEDQLGRSLIPECCCSRRLSVDEAAVVGLLRHSAEPSPLNGSPAVPYGLRGSLIWAARACARELGAMTPPVPSRRSAVCAFGTV